MGSPREELVLDADLVLRWCRVAVDALAEVRADLDAINVFPVPDSDTGTNLYLTLDGALDAASPDDGGSTAAERVGALAAAVVTTARGNSGAILAQMLVAVVQVLSGPSDQPPGRRLAQALDAAAEHTHTAVARPVEGTMVTVARAAADAAAAAADAAPGDLTAVGTAAARAARRAVAATPQQLPALRRAGVVDAGAQGVSVLLDAFDTTVTGRRPPPRVRRLGEGAVPLTEPVAPPAAGTEPSSETPPSVEVVYVVAAPDDGVAELRAQLAGLGDSVVVSGAQGRWAVHVHTHAPGPAVQAGLDRGRVTDLRLSVLPAGLPGRAVLALAAGDGLAGVFASAGASVHPLEGTRAPRTGAVLAAIRGLGTGEVVVLPNGPARTRVAEAAAAVARADGLRVAVVPSVSQVQGLAAAAVHDPTRSYEDDLVAMTTAAARTRHGAVTVATREAVTMAGVCRVGDVLGVLDGDFAVIGSDLAAVAATVTARLLAAGGELLTLVLGADADAELADRLAERVRAEHPEVDCVVYDGGPSRYPLLLGVE